MFLNWNTLLIITAISGVLIGLAIGAIPLIWGH